MNTFIRVLTCSAALAATIPVFAEDEDSAEKPAEAAAEGEGEGAKAAEDTEHLNKLFHVLPLCRRLEGQGQVLKPGAAEWVALEEGRFYPLGCSYRTVGPDSRLTVQFGVQCEVKLVGEASFGTRAQELSVKSRTVVLENGKITLSLPRNFPEGRFIVSAPGFVVENPAGDSTYEYETTGDGDNVSVRCVSGTLQVKGRHFKMPALRAANEFRIRTSQDQLFTGLFGVAGDIPTVLDQGLVSVKDFESGEMKVEKRLLEWRLSPQTAVRIGRAVPEVGEKLSVTVMTFDASGALKNRCAFTEGRPEVNTGEMGPTSAKEKEEIAKRAAEATSTIGSSEEETTEETTEESSDDAN